MIALAAFWAAAVALIVGLALALPCAACRARRERLKSALATLRAKTPPKRLSGE